MNLSRHSRFVIALVALVSMLFMQLALSAYACPAPAGNAAVETMMNRVVMESADMPGCTGMDIEQPSLCHTYDHPGKHAFDKPDLDLPPVQPFVATSMIILGGLVTSPADWTGFAPRQPSLSHAAAPPLSIRHCCFRI